MTFTTVTCFICITIGYSVLNMP
uniref:Uncharacterized protein n=1 Tax=Anguilla anguilla TaxID=7936 RepID=A0A0E9TRX1_ANGAN